MPSLLFVAILALASSYGVFGAPSCHHGKTNADCVSKCKAKMGWPGHAMGSHHWGPVTHKTDKNIGDLVNNACNVSQPSSAGTPSSGNCSMTVASHASYTPKPYTVVYTSSTGSAVKPTTPPAGNLKVSTSSGIKSDTSKSVPTLSPTTQQTPTSTHSVVPSSSALDSTGGSGDTSPEDISAYLSAHNNVRAQHGANPLTWNNELSAKALSWAKGCLFKHSGSGENLAAGSADDYTIATAIKSWTDEVSTYDPSNPQASHFTQVVWKGTTQVGCAHADCNGIFDPKFGIAHYHVCEYSPPGNVIGEFAQNVQV